MPISIPAQITVPFATSGLKNAIPANANNVTGNAGYDVGFPSINMTPTTAGGIPPFGQDFNGIIFDMTTAIRFMQAGGTFVFSSAFATAVGGYPIGAIVQRTDNTGFWRNTVANNSTDPEAGGAGWQPESSGSTAITMTNANVTLTSLQAAKPIIIITGTLTTNVNLIFPTYQAKWVIVNRTTGAFSITCKTAAGSGIVATGIRSIIGDGTNIINATSGSLLNVQVFTTTGTYTPTAGTNSVIVEVQGAGGAGGGAPATGAGVSSLGACGGAGAYAKSLITSAFSGVTVTVGTGGTGVSGAAGNNGNPSSFGALISCPGGRGGSTAGPSGTSFYVGSTNSTAPSGGNIISAIGQGGDSIISQGSSSLAFGRPGQSVFGAGSQVASAGVNGTASTSPGAGGCPTGNTPSTAALTGGAGAPGIVIVWEYS